MYPFATPNETDFKNLMDVYLNAVFCPLAMVDKGVFEQEDINTVRIIPIANITPSVEANIILKNCFISIEN